MNDLSDAILQCSEEVVLTRHVSVSMEKGMKVDPRVETFRLNASITPITGQDLKRLGENQRVEGTILIITPTKLLNAESSSCRIADMLHWHDADYQVGVVKDWSYQGGFYECIGTRRQR